MPELVLRSAVERLQILELAEETAPLNRSASRHLNAIIGKLKEMQLLLKVKPVRKNRELQIEELNYQLEDVIESYHVLARSSKTWGLNGIKIIWLQKFGLSSALKKIKLKIKIIINEMKLDPFIVADRSPVERKTKLIGLDEDQKKVLKFLLSDDDADSSYSSSSSSSHIGVPVTSICGDVGSGKTTLAKLVFEDLDVAEKFQTRIWINVTGKFKIIEQIIGCGDRSMSCIPEEQLSEQIEKILNSERSLIVLDDIRSAEAWENICEILPKLVKGSYVLVTTRVGRVAECISQKQFVHNMTPLNETDSLALFTKVFSHQDGDCISLANDEATTSSAENDNREHKMIMEKVRYCDGLPLLIKDLALYLQSKRREERKMLLENHPQACLSEFYCRVYNELPDYLQPCFMYLGHFLEDQEIDPEKLSHLWMIEGLLLTGQSARGERMMDMTERYLRELTLKGMVEVQAEEAPATTKKFKACRFIQGMEKFCESNCERKRFLKMVDLRQEDCSLSSNDGPRRLVIYLGKHKVDISPKVAKNIRSLRVILLRNQQQIPENELVCPAKMLNLKKFGVLRILTFNGIDFQRRKLPRGIFNLELLRYLSFKGCVLEELPSSISKLSYLQVLDLRVEEGLVETKIPNVLRKLRRLNHLYLPLKFATQNGEKLLLDSLTELETLVNFNTTLCRANDVLKLCKLRHLTAKVEGNFDDFESITNYMKTSSSNNWPLQCSIDIINLDCYAEERHSVLREFYGVRYYEPCTSKDILAAYHHTMKSPRISLL